MWTSELGQGSCFEVLLDLKIAEDRTVALVGTRRNR